MVCGAGNNAGDGYVVARLAHAAGLAVTVLECAERGRLKGDARTAAEAAMAAGIVPQAFDAALLPQHDLIVDALLGTGLAREVGGAIGLWPSRRSTAAACRSWPSIYPRGSMPTPGPSWVAR